MEEMQARLLLLNSDFDYFLAKTDPDELTYDDLDRYFEQLKNVWGDASRAWLESRKVDKG
jgi:hypothetical protein